MKIEGGWGYVKREYIRSYVHELFKEKFEMKDYAPNLGEGGKNIKLFRIKNPGYIDYCLAAPLH